MTVNDLSYETVTSVNPLYLITDKIIGFTEESTKYLALVPTDDSKKTLKEYEEVQKNKNKNQRSY